MKVANLCVNNRPAGRNGLDFNKRSKCNGFVRVLLRIYVVLLFIFGCHM